MGQDLVTLRLGGAGLTSRTDDGGLPAAARPDTDVFRQTLDEAFRALADLLAPVDSGPSAEANSAIARCRAALASGIAAEMFDQLARSCFDSTRDVASHARIRDTEQREQVAALLDVVRDTVAAVTGEQTALHVNLTGSADRFEGLARVNNLHQIHVQLLAEVRSLRRMNQERQAAWDRTLGEFGERLVGLETQLNDTRREAALDPLTSVANRRTFERICREWMAPGRPGFVMAMVDVDDFKAINDRKGHAVGDRVLVTVAQTLGQSLRTDDLVARMGGDEFVVLARPLTLSQAERRFDVVGRAVHTACADLAPEGPAPSISIGLAEYSAGDTFEGLQQRADEALYQAKRNGKGRISTKAAPFIRDLMKAR